MNVKFKSTKKENFEEKETVVVDTVAKLISKNENEENISIEFDEERENKIIKNKFIFNDSSLKIESKEINLECKKNEITKNIIEFPEVKITVSIYSKLMEAKIENNYFYFKYLISANEKFDHFTEIKIELEIRDN